MPENVVVAIPVRDEEERITACLDALHRQTVAPCAIVLLLNNCQDGTLAICTARQANWPQLHIVERELRGALASAGEARRLALEIAAELAGNGVILTSDADSIAPPHWVEANIREIAKGAEVVCGTAAVDPVEALLVTQDMHHDYLDECACFDLLDEVDAILNPDPADPWPRHQQNSGASIAVRAAAFRHAGGAPAVASGEDRALVQRLRLIDARIRHAFGISVTVSGRLEGRAAGGMAEAMKRRLQKRDAFTDDRLEPATDAYRRSLAKAACRAAWLGQRGAKALAEELLVAPTIMECLLSVPFFGAAWAEIQHHSPVLKQRRRVRYEDLPRETMHAKLLRDQLLLEPARHAVA